MNNLLAGIGKATTNGKNDLLRSLNYDELMTDRDLLCCSHYQSSYQTFLTVEIKFTDCLFSFHQQVFSSGFIEDEEQEALEVDFANKYLGGGALSRGCVQVSFFQLTDY